MFLLDTNVVSELRRRKPHGAVLAWLEDVPNSALHLSAVTVGEIQAGVEMTREQDPSRAAEIETWLDHIAAVYNVLPMDAHTFRIYARLMHQQSGALIEDAMIAATAEANTLTVVTRNIKHFRLFGARTLNPFAASG